MSTAEIDELVAGFHYGANDMPRSSGGGQDDDEVMVDVPSDSSGDSLVANLFQDFAARAVETGTLARHHAVRLVVRARFDLGGLEDALAAAPASTDKRAFRRHTAESLRPSARNSFYKPSLLLQTAAQDIFAYFTEAANWLSHYRDSFAPSEVAASLRKAKSTLNMILTHMSWTVEFLKIGRRDMDVTMLPDYFWTDVLPRVNRVVELFGQLSKWKGCDVLRAKGMMPAQDVFDRLEYLQAKRKRIGEENIRKQEAEGWKADVQPATSFVLPVRTAPADRG